MHLMTFAGVDRFPALTLNNIQAHMHPAHTIPVLRRLDTNILYTVSDIEVAVYKAIN